MKGILGETKKKKDDIYSSDAYNLALGYAEKMRPPTFSQASPVKNTSNITSDAYTQAKSYADSMRPPDFQPLVPAASQSANTNTVRKNYDINADYTSLMNDAIARGDYGAAAQYERLHNEKNGDLGLGYQNSGIFNYLDMNGLGGLKEGKRQELENYMNQGFNYNYEEDPEYQAIRRLKEKEADKAYKDGYAQMSAAFDGDIPVNMMNKLIASKNEIVDQADSYIPELKAAAYNMYMDKANNLYNQYNMLANEEAADYNKWLAERDMFIQGNENEYGRAWNEDERTYGRAWNEDERAYNRAWNEDERTDSRNWRQIEFDNANAWNQAYFDQDSIRYWNDFNYKKDYDEWYKRYLLDQMERDDKYRYTALYV